MTETAHRAQTEPPVEWLDRLADWVGVASGHGARAARLLALVFVVSLGLVMLKAAQTGIFLGAYGRRAIPWAFAASAVALALSSAVAAAVTERLGTVRVTRAVLIAALIGLLAMRAGVLASARSIRFVVYVACEATSGLLLIHLWSTVSSSVDARSSRRLLPIAGMGAALAWLTGGLAVVPTCRAVGAPNLLILSSVFIAAGLVLLALVAAYDIEPAATRGRQSAGLVEGWRAGLQFVRSERLMQVAAGLSLLALVSEQVMELQLLTAARERYRSPDAIASFFGAFYGLTSGLGIVFLAGAAPRLLARLGTVGALLITPIVTIATSVVSAIVGGFGPALALRGTDRVLKSTIWPSATEQLQMPLPALRRAQARALVRGVLAPGGYALCAIALAFWPETLSVRHVAWVIVIASVGMLSLVAIQTRRELVPRLHRAVSDRQLSLDGAAITHTTLDGASFQALERDLSHGDASEAGQAAAILALDDRGAAVEALALGLLHPALDVRLACVNGLAHHPCADAAHALAGALLRERRPDARRRMVEVIEGMGVDSDAVERTFAHVCENASDVERARIRVARCVLQSGRADVLPELIDVIETAPAEVAPAAFDALPASASTSQQVTDLVIARLRANDREARLASARAAVRLRIGVARDAVVAALRDPRDTHAIAEILADAPARRTRRADGTRDRGDFIGIDALLDDPDVHVGAAMIIALGRAVRRGVRGPIAMSIVLPRIRRAVGDAARLTSVLAGIARNDGIVDWNVEPAFEFLAHEIELRIESIRRDVLALLVLLGRRRLAATVEVGRRRRSPARDALIAELLETELPRSLGAWVVPLFEQQALRDRVRTWQQMGLLDARALDEPWAALVEFGDAHLLRCAEDVCPESMRAVVRSARGKDPEMLPAIEHLKLLRKFDLFEELTAEDLLSIAKVVEPLHYVTGQQVFDKGDAGDELFLLVDGSVEIRDGDRVLATLGSGQFFGDLAVIDQQPRSAGASCVGETTLLRLRGSDLEEMMTARPSIARHFLRVLAARLRDVNRRAAPLP